MKSIERLSHPRSTWAARAVVFDPLGRLLVAQRSFEFCKTNKGKWEVPGGKQEPQHKTFGLAYTAELETHQEVGVEVEPIPKHTRPVLIHKHSYLNDNGEVVKHFTAFYLALAHTVGITLQPQEAEAAGWLHLPEVHELNLTPATREMLDTIQSKTWGNGPAKDILAEAAVSRLIAV